MGTTTAIEWTDATWNCWQGCHKVSPGCKNCYMFTEKKRFGQDPNTVVRSSAATFNAPLKWARNPEKYSHIKRIFVDSWSDFFIEEADAWRAEAWAIIRTTPQFIYQLCTKRPERILQCLPDDWENGYPNVWMGTTTEDQARADERIPQLLRVPAAVRFISAEPLLGPLDLTHVDWVAEMEHVFAKGASKQTEFSATFAEMAEGIRNCKWEEGRAWRNVLTGAWFDGWDGDDKPEPMHRTLDWVICGGESGPGARQMNPDWARGLRDQCMTAGVPFFFKQWGEWAPNWLNDENGKLPNSEWMDRMGKKLAGSLLDGREWKQFPIF